jgi:ADP-heptose:LPS heptosyltransferase
MKNKPILAGFKSIAVIQTAFIGDIALTLQLAAKIKQINPNCKLSFITTPLASEIPSLLTDIDNVIIFDKRIIHKGIKGLIRFKKEIEFNNFDCIIAPHRSARTALLTKLLNPKISVSFNTASFSFLYSKRVKYKIHLHEKERNMSLLSIFSDYDPTSTLPTREGLKVDNLPMNSRISPKNSINVILSLRRIQLKVYSFLKISVQRTFLLFYWILHFVQNDIIFRYAQTLHLKKGIKKKPNPNPTHLTREGLKKNEKPTSTLRTRDGLTKNENPTPTLPTSEGVRPMLIPSLVGMVRVGYELNLKFNKSDIDFVNNLILENNLEDKNFVIIAPGSVWETKKWKEYYFAALVQQIESNIIKCVLIGSESDYALCKRISLNTESIIFAGKTTISQTIILMKHAKMVITNDSAPIHFAGLANCFTIAIFGPTTPKFGFGPTGINDIIIENNSLKCRPCAIHGGKTCPLGTHECMTSITPELVISKMQRG